MELHDHRWKLIEGLFGKISKANHPILSSSLQNIHFSKGEEILTEGVKTASLYLVLSGKLKTSLVVENNHIELSELVAGDFFGEVSLLDPGPASATITATEDGDFVVFSHTALINLQKEHPHFFSIIIKRISVHLAESLRRSGRGRLEQNNRSWTIESPKENKQNIFSWFGKIIFGK